MAYGKRSKIPAEINLNLTSMIDITSFILLALAILSMAIKKEASLDNILKLPPILYANKQDSTQLQIYILPARILADGFIDPDSTGLVAFTGKGKAPYFCERCSLQFRQPATSEYIPNSLLDMSKKPLAALQKGEITEEDQAKLSNMRPEAYYCSRCGFEISPYLKLDEIPLALRKKKQEVVNEIVLTENASREKNGRELLKEEDIKKIKDGIPLMIKADEKAFYGRILQVVNMAKDTMCDIKKFAFVSLAEASLEAQKKEKEVKKGGHE